MVKNQAGQHVYVQMNRRDGAPLTAGVTIRVSGGGATPVVGAAALSNLGEGLWSYPPTAAETNHDVVAFHFAGPSAVNQVVVYETTGHDGGVPITKTLETAEDFWNYTGPGGRTLTDPAEPPAQTEVKFVVRGGNVDVTNDTITGVLDVEPEVSA